MKKIIVMIVAVFILSIAACSNETGVSIDRQDTKKSVKVAVLNGPTGMGMVKLMEDQEEGKTELEYDFTLAASPDDLVGKIISKEVDIAAVPTNLAMVLHNRTEGQIQLAAVNTLGVLYVLEKGDTISSIQDLEGKTVNLSGKGSMPEYIFNYLLDKNGVEDVIVDYSLQHADLAAAVAAGDIDVALLPQPHVSSALMRNEDVRIALDMTQEWKKISDLGELSMGVIIVQKEFAQKHKDSLNVFLDEYKKSVEFVNQDIDVAAHLIEKYKVLPNAEIAKRAIPYSNIVYIDAKEARGSLNELYEILYSFEPKSVGGKLADEGFYYKK
ncbi:UNVERIFIED_CONTAM: NitT/TauT family transport system substrate-binding protein [Acetivibrio alkalicellulosi]